MQTLATWCVRHRLVVLLLWVAALVGASFASRAVGTAYSNSFSLPHTESTEAIALLQAAAPKQAGDTEQIVFQTTDGKKVSDPDVQATDHHHARQGGPGARTSPRSPSPYPPTGATPLQEATAATQVSKDGTTAFATVTFNEQAQYIDVTQAQHFVNTAKTADGPGLTVAVAGQVAETSNKQSFGGTGPGVLLALIVLGLVFASLFAALLPILTALASLGTAIGVIGLLSHVIKMPQFSVELVLLIGLGVGVDYALFIVTRHRQGLVAGKDIEESIVNAVNTSGRAVIFAGIIVCIALLGMFALGVTFLYGLAVAAAIGVAFTMIAALTLLPALLGFIGPKVMSRKQRRSLAENGPRIVGAGLQGLLAEVGGLHPQPSGRPGRRRPDHRGPGGPAVLLAPPRLGRPGQRPDVHHHPAGLRPAGRGVRPRLQRTAAAGGRPRRHRRHRGPRPPGRRDAGPARRGRGVAARVAAAARRQAGVADHRLPDHVAAVRRHHRPDQPDPGHHHPRGGGRHRHHRLRGRRPPPSSPTSPRCSRPSCPSSSAWW